MEDKKAMPPREVCFLTGVARAVGGSANMGTVAKMLENDKVMLFVKRKWANIAMDIIKWRLRDFLKKYL